MQTFKHTFYAGVMGLALVTTPLWSTQAATMDSTDLSPNDNLSRKNKNSVDWDAENSYWRENYPKRPYYKKDQDYSQYEPAYKYGAESYSRYDGKPYDQVNESEMKSGWEKFKGDSKLTWEHAKYAVKDAYERMRSKFSKSDNTTNSSY